MRKTIVPMLALGLALAACGKKEMLREADNVPLPRKPATSAIQPKPADLLARDSQAVPSRFNEIVTKSQELQPSRFDMPPPGR